jgi:leucyl-tRNA synthetase
LSLQNNYGNYHHIKNNNDSTIKVPVDGDNIIITAALPYANGEIHIGHIASTYLPADIFADLTDVSESKSRIYAARMIMELLS